MSIDTGIHYRNKNLEWARKMQEQYVVLDDAETINNKLVRYMSIPAQAVEFWVGRTAIVNARKKAEKELGDLFDIKDFHYQV